MIQTTSSQVLHVHPTAGRDRAAGTASDPLKTLTAALRQAQLGITVRLAPGTYRAETGEQFPIVIPAGVVVVGDEDVKGQGVVIEGGGVYDSPTFARQTVTILPADGAELRGLTITNPLERGTGIWIESTSPAIANNTLMNCKREGIFVTGAARPLILSNLVQANASSGMFFARFAKGEVRNNVCQRTGYGLAISDQAAPLIVDNQLVENRAGIVVSRSARPVLRNNGIARNTGDGLVVMNQAAPDLGQPQRPGNNLFQGNAQFDVRTTSSVPLVSVGNQINPTKVEGAIEFGVSLVPTLGMAVASPSPAPSPVPSPAPAPVPTPPPVPPTPSNLARFPDVNGYWAQPFIERLAERGIITGFPDRTFRPDTHLTRAQYATMVARAFDLPAKRVSRGFSDVPSTFWGADAIRRAERMGFISGFPDGTFRPHENLTRVQAFVSLVNGLALTGGSPNLLNRYRDRAQIPSYAIAAIATATQQRLVVNHPHIGYLEPLFDVTRAEISAILYQALVARGQAPSIPSAFIIEPSPTTTSFADIGTHWAADFIRGLASQGLLGGFNDGTFKPDAAMNRAHYAVLLAKVFQPSPRRSPVKFIDVQPDHWAAAAIQQVYQGGLLSGFGDGTFQPTQDIFRLHVLLSLVNALELSGGSPDLLRRYDDYNAIPVYARSAIASATQHRLVVNYPNPRQLAPNQGSSRAEVAAMVYQALVLTGRTEAIASAYIV